jgi:O-antigen/teichoic acid export membrane protein
MYGISSVIGQIAGLVLVPFFTNELSPSDYGLLNMTALVLAFISPVAGLALDTALFRFFSMEDSDLVKASLFSTASIIKTLTVFLTTICLMPFYFQINKYVFESQLSPLLFALILISFMVDNFSSLSAVVLRSQRKVKLVAINSVLYVFSSILFSVIFVLVLHWGVLGSVIGGVLAGLFKAALYLRVNKKVFSFSLFSYPKAKEMLVYSLPMVPHKIQGNIIGLFTSFMINQKFGLVYSGYYAVASKVSRPLVFIVTMVQQSWTPYKFHIHKTDQNPSKTFSEIIGFYWIFLVFVWVFTGLSTPLLFKLLINERYHEAQAYVPFLMFVSVAQALYFTVTTGFELKKDQKKMVLASFLGMSFLIGFSLLLINFRQPYMFFVVQALSFFVLASIIYQDAKKIIEIKYPFIVIAVFIGLAAIILYLNFQFNNLGMTGALVLVLIVVTGFIFKWIFPQYPLRRIPERLKMLKFRKS